MGTKVVPLESPGLKKYNYQLLTFLACLCTSQTSFSVSHLEQYTWMGGCDICIGGLVPTVLVGLVQAFAWALLKRLSQSKTTVVLFCRHIAVYYWAFSSCCAEVILETLSDDWKALVFLFLSPRSRLEIIQFAMVWHSEGSSSEAKTAVVERLETVRTVYNRTTESSRQMSIGVLYKCRLKFQIWPVIDIGYSLQ